MPEAPTNPYSKPKKKSNTLFLFFAHPAVYLMFCLLMLWWLYWICALMPFTLLLLPTFIVFLAPLVLGQVGMVIKRKYIQALLAFLLIPGVVYPISSIPSSTSDAQWRKEEPAMVLLADTVLHDPKYANTKGTVEIPLPKNLSTLTNGKPLRVKFPEQRKDSCQVCFFSYENSNGEGIYYIYESDPPKPVVSHYVFADNKGDEYFGDIRKNFRLGRIH